MSKLKRGDAMNLFKTGQHIALIRHGYCGKSSINCCVLNIVYKGSFVMVGGAKFCPLLADVSIHSVRRMSGDIWPNFA